MGWNLSSLFKSKAENANKEDDGMSQPLNPGGGVQAEGLELPQLDTQQSVLVTSDPEKPRDPALYWTEENTRALQVQAANPFATNLHASLDNMETHDLCFVFPKDVDDQQLDNSFISEVADEEKIIPMEELQEILLEVMWKRAAPTDGVDGEAVMKEKSLKYLSDLYDIAEDIENLPEAGAPLTTLRRIMRENFLRSLRHFIVCDVKEVKTAMPEAEDLIFYRVRVTEKAARLIADESEYLVQMDRKVAFHEALRYDPKFVSPYAAYEEAFESLPNVSCLESAGLIWKRYDRLARPMEVDSYDPNAKELSIFRDLDRSRLLMRALDVLYNFDAMEEHGLLEGIFVLHQPYNLRILKDEWASFRKTVSPTQPLDQIRDYFGEELGLYFAWLGFYTASLRWPAAFGLILHILQEAYDPELMFDVGWLNGVRLLFSLFLIAWCTWFFYEWKRTENAFALRWGLETMAGFGARQRERRHFKADRIVKDPIEPDRWIRSFSPAKLVIRNLISNTLTVVVTVFCIVACNQTFHNWILSRFFGADVEDDEDDTAEGEVLGPDGKPMAEKIPFMYVVVDYLSEWVDIASWVTAILVKVCDMLFGYVVVRLVEYENHQYENDYSESLVLKIFFFKALDYFTPLVYLAFFKHYISPCPGESCVQSLRSQLMSIFVVDFISNVVEIGQPAIVHWIRRRKTPPDADPVESQFLMEEYEDTVEDYEEMITQYGLVTLFSLVCPIIPLLACVSNHAEIRVDAYKLSNSYQRPFPKEIQDIGAWMTVLQFMTLLVVIMNVALIVFATVGKHYLFTSKLAWCLVLLTSAVGVKEMIQHFWPNDTADARIVRGRMMLVSHEAIWGAYDNKYDEKEIAKNKSKQDEIDRLYGSDD